MNKLLAYEFEVIDEKINFSQNEENLIKSNFTLYKSKSLIKKYKLLTLTSYLFPLPLPELTFWHVWPSRT